MTSSLVVRLSATMAVIMLVAFGAWVVIFQRSSAVTFVDVQAESRSRAAGAGDDQAHIDTIQDAWSTDGWDGVRRTAAAVVPGAAGFIVVNADRRVAATTNPVWLQGDVRARDDGGFLLTVDAEDDGRVAEMELVESHPVVLAGEDGRVWGWYVPLPPAVSQGGDPGTEFTARVWRSAAGWLVAVVLLAMGATLWVMRSALVPIARVTEAARELQRGATPERLARSGPKEFHGLIDAFNAAADAIAGTERLRRQVIADVGHELRTPVTNIKAQLEAAGQGVIPLDRELMVTLESDVRLLERLVDDFQQLVLSDAGRLDMRPRTFPLRDELAAIVGPLAQAAGARWSVDGPEHLLAYADADRLRQVVVNLTENAVRHRPDGLVLTLEVRAEGDAVAFEYRDNGPGVAAEDVPHIFERFYRAERSRNRTTGGAGLGLAIARSLVDAMGGSIRYTPAPAGGAGFVVVLPVGKKGR